MNRRLATCTIAAACALGIALALLWLLYTVFAPGLIAAACAGQAPAALARWLPVRTDMPLDYNLARAESVFFTGYRALTALWTLLVAAALLLTRRLAWTRPAAAPAAALPAARVRLILTAVFALAFLAAPYWSTLPTTALQLAALAALLAAAWAWSRAAAGAACPCARPAPARLHDAAWLAALLLLINARPLGADIPWMGDEDYHIMQIVHLCETAVPAWVLTVALIAWIAAAGRLASSRDARLLTLVLLAVAALGGSAHPHLDGSVLRYPYLTRWLQALPLQPLFPFNGLFYQESLFRLVPLVSTLALAAVVAAELRAAPRLPRLAFALAVATVPTMLYYTSTLALELPALVAMTIVCFRADALLTRPPADVRAAPAWLALLAIGFIKETVVPFLAAFVACRLLYAILRTRSPRALAAEARLLVAILAPLVIYIGFRTCAAVFREFGGSWLNAFDPALYLTLARSWWEQFGPLLLLAAAGLVLQARRDRASALLAAAAIAAGGLFFIIDEAQYVGFSRYNLIVLPPLVCAATWCFRAIAVRPRLAVPVAALLLAANAAMAPLFADGARHPGWGGSAADVAERNYPYRDALRGLRAAHGDQRIYFAGLGYPYYADFYFRRWDWHPDGISETQRLPLPEALRAARVAACEVVLYPVPPGEPRPAGGAVAGFECERLVENRAHMIAIYTRQPRAATPAPAP